MGSSFRVSDDGRGFDTRETAHGTGLQGMADRLDAVGGRIELDSSPGGGTTVSGTVPVDAPEAAAAGDEPGLEPRPSPILG